MDTELPPGSRATLTKLARIGSSKSAHLSFGSANRLSVDTTIAQANQGMALLENKGADRYPTEVEKVRFDTDYFRTVRLPISVSDSAFVVVGSRTS